MLVRVVFAVACSIAALKYAQFRTTRDKRHDSHEALARDGGCSYNDKEICTHAIKYGTSQEKENKIKRGSIGSPSSSSRSLQGNDQLLLPEFDDLCQEVIDISSDSDNSAPTPGRYSHESEQRLKYNSDCSIESKKYDSNSDDDDALEAFEALTTFTNHDNAPLNNSAEILELKSIIQDPRERETKLEADLLCYYGVKEQEDKFIVVERQLLRKNAELMSIIEEFKEREAQHKAELLQYYGMREQENMYKDMERQLLSKIGEIEKLSASMNSLQEQNNEMAEELQGQECLIEELMFARDKIKDLQSSQDCLKRELDIAWNELKDMQMTLQTDANQSKEQLFFLRQQVSELKDREHEASKKCSEMERKLEKSIESEAKVASLSKKCNALEQREHELTVKLATAEAKLIEMSSITEGNIMAKVQAQTLMIRQENEDLRKQVEGLQMSRLGEAEELLDLRWLNVCLRNEVQHYKVIIQKAIDLTLAKNLSLDSKQKAIQITLEYGDLEKVTTKPIHQIEQDFESISSLPSTPAEHARDDSLMDCHLERDPRSKKSSFIKKFKKWGKSKRVAQSSTSSDLRGTGSGTSSPIHGSSMLKDSLQGHLMRNTSDWTSVAVGQSNVLSGRNSISDCSGTQGELAPIRTRSKVSNAELLGMVVPSSSMIPKMVLDTEEGKGLSIKHIHSLSLVREKTLSEMVDHTRIGQQEAPKPLMVQSRKIDKHTSNLVYLHGRDPTITIPVPDSVPVHIGSDLASEQMHLAPLTANRQENAQVHQSLMRTKGKKYSVLEPPVGGTCDSGSLSFALSGEFIQYLAKEVQNATYEEIDDVVAFVNWLDGELSLLVDEHAVLKHFDWPETKANSLREAAYGYEDLSKLEAKINSFKDDSSLACEASLSNMLSMLEKVEQNVYPLLRIRDLAIAQYKDLSIPSEWMLDSGLIGKIKLATVRLASQFMRRVVSEVESLANACAVKVPRGEFLLLLGVRFALRVYQFSGGFDAESMHAFEDLRLCLSTSTPCQAQ